MTSPRTLPASMVGLEVGPATHTIDARWLMAYAAAVGMHDDARYFDTQGAGGPLAHALFAVCYEWPLALAVRDRAIGADIAPFGVHATHALTIHRPPRAGDTLHTTARVMSAEPRRSGTLVTVRFSTRDAAGAAVTTTDYGSVYRGVALTGSGAAPAPPRPRPPAADVAWQDPVEIDAGAAHVYTECARIWNPIHTDIAVARAAGLPGLILHGTATLALAVSRVAARAAAGDGRRVRTVQARFTGMVSMPSTLTVRGHAARAGAIGFDALSADGACVLEGALSL